MALPQPLEHFLKHPGMYLARAADFDVVAAFIQGFNFGASGGPLAGFREWLIVKLGYGNNLPWDDLVLRLAFPGDESPKSTLSKAAGHKVALEKLSILLEEFWKDRNSNAGFRGIYVRYHNWLKAQDWYGPSSPDWIPENSPKSDAAKGRKIMAAG